MSVEGMWAVYFGDVADQQINAGVVSFKSDRLFGGDSLTAYLGDYQFDGISITAEFKTWAYNPAVDVVTAFGDLNPAPFHCAMEGEFDDASGEIDATIWKVANPEKRFPAKFVKITDLP